jgi:hypothetical protein
LKKVSKPVNFGPLDRRISAMRKMNRTIKYVLLLLASVMYLGIVVPATAQDSPSLFTSQLLSGVLERSSEARANNGEKITVILFDIGGYSWLLNVDGSAVTGYFYENGMNAWPVQGTAALLQVCLEAENPKVGSPYAVFSLKFDGTVQLVGTTWVLVGTLVEHGPTYEYSNPWWAYILSPDPPFF